jgi:hypothetical protein
MQFAKETPMTTIHETLHGLASQFTNEVLAAIRTASVEDLLGDSVTARASRPATTSHRTIAPNAKAKPGRLARRGPEEIGKMIERISGLLAKSPAGLRAENLREKLGVDAKELPRPLADGLKQRRFTSKGQKRATTYYAASGAKKKTPAKKAAKK